MMYGPRAGPKKKKKRGPKVHISCTWVQCAIFLGQGGYFCLLIGPNNTNMVDDIEILLPVKFHLIPFSGLRGEVKNV